MDKVKNSRKLLNTGKRARALRDARAARTILKSWSRAEVSNSAIELQQFSRQDHSKHSGCSKREGCSLSSFLGCFSLKSLGTPFLRCQSKVHSFASSLLSVVSLRLLAVCGVVLLVISLGWMVYADYQGRYQFVAPQSTMVVDSNIQEPLLLPISKGMIRHAVKKGETWDSILQRYGLGSGVGTKLDSSLKALHQKNKVRGTINPKQILLFSFTSDQGVKEVATQIDKMNTVVLKRRADGLFEGVLKRVALSDEKRVMAGSISDSSPTFAQAVLKAGGTYELIDEFVDLFSNRVRFRRDFRKGDHFVIICGAKILGDRDVAKLGPVLAASLEVGRRSLKAVRYVGADKRERYFDQNGKYLDNSFLRYPLKFTRISSQYSHSRFHPILKRRIPHYGVDFAAPVGTPVRSVADGHVIYSGRKGANGILVKVQHNERYRTAYLHLSKVAHGVKKGKLVTRGQVIGYVGRTGLSTGPHLDFRFYDRGKPVDPLKIDLPSVEKLTPDKQVDKEYLKRELFTLKRYEQMDFLKLVSL